jgi:hypothetical protein
MDSVMTPPKNLLFEVSPTEVTLTPDEGTALHLHTDGKAVKAEDGTSLQRKTKWDGNSLVSETEVGPSLSVKQTYAIGTDGRLQVTDHVQRQYGHAVDIHRVYDRAVAVEAPTVGAGTPPAAPAASPAPVPSPVQPAGRE